MDMIEIICNNKTDSSPIFPELCLENKIKLSLLNRSQEVFLAYMTSHITTANYILPYAINVY